jgi:hypothetical protein
MLAQDFDSDAKYQHLLAEFPNGFVVNTTRAASPNYMVLHRASCDSISDPAPDTAPGGFTERSYIKVCAPDIESLRDWVALNGRQDRTFSKECGRCRPTG